MIFLPTRRLDMVALAVEAGGVPAYAFAKFQAQRRASYDVQPDPLQPFRNSHAGAREALCIFAD